MGFFPVISKMEARLDGKTIISISDLLHIAFTYHLARYYIGVKLSDLIFKSSSYSLSCPTSKGGGST